MVRTVRVTIGCPNRYVVGAERCTEHHYKDVPAAEHYVASYRSSQNEYAARDAAGQAFTALLERILDLEEEVRRLRGDAPTSLQDSE